MRSMTAAAGRLLLVEPSPRGATGSLLRFTEVGVFRLVLGVLEASTRPPPIMVTSDTSRSSSSSNAAALVDCRLSESCDFVDQRPLGSIVTVSND